MSSKSVWGWVIVGSLWLVACSGGDDGGAAGVDDATSQGDVPTTGPCADGGGCDKNATCTADGDKPKCVCNDGWSGTGTSCGFDGVIVSDIDTFEVGGFTTSLPGDPADYASIKLVALVGDTQTPFTSDPPVDGLYYFPKVPTGTYTLEMWRAPNSSLVGAGKTVTIIESDERTLSIGTDFAYRAGTTLLTKPTTIALSGTLAAPWETTTTFEDGGSSDLEDELLIYSRGAFLYSNLTTTGEGDGGAGGPRRGDTELDGWLIDLGQTSLLGDARALDGAVGDELVVAHVRHARSPEEGEPVLGMDEVWTLSSWFKVPNVTLEDGGNLPVTGNFQATASTSSSMAYDGGAFNALLTPFESKITGGFVTASIISEGAKPTPKVGPYLTLANAVSFGEPGWVDPVCNGETDPCDPDECPNGCSLESRYVFPVERTANFSFVNPFDYGQLLADNTLTFTARVTSFLPVDETSDRVRGSITVSDAVSVLTAGPVKPVVGLPTGIQIGGQDAPLDVGINGVGFTPEITWKAPTLGVPTRYRVQVWELTDLKTADDVVIPRRAVLNAYVEDTSLAVPPGILAPGRHYAVDIVAETYGTADPATPFASAAAIAAGRMPSGVFAPCSCHKDAECTVNDAGAESCACPEGWEGDGHFCDVLPCTYDNGGCAPDATCTNGDTAICTCPDGFTHLDWGECVLSGERCDAPLLLESTATGTTVGFTDDYALDDGNPCLGVSMGGGSPEVVYGFTAPSTGEFTFTLDAAHDAVISVRPECDGGCLGADMERDGSGKFTVTVSLEAGQQVFVVIDGYANELTPYTGPYTLTVATATPT